MIQSHQHIYLTAVAGGALVGFGLVTLAGAAPEERRGPPPEAIAACEDQVEGSDCAVEFRGRTVEGTCVGGPDTDAPLACMPEGGRPSGPPPEAFDACDGSDEGDSCSVELPDHTIDGTCRADRNDESTLVCVPARRERS
jgi:hypothetical protein